MVVSKSCFNTPQGPSLSLDGLKFLSKNWLVDPYPTGVAPPSTATVIPIATAPLDVPPISSEDKVTNSPSVYPYPGRLGCTLSMSPPDVLSTLKVAPVPMPDVVTTGTS